MGIAVDAAIPGYMGLSITSAFNLGAGGTNPGYFNSTGFQIADDFDYILGKHQIAVGVSYIRTSIEATQTVRPTARSRSTARTRGWASPTSWSGG